MFIQKLVHLFYIFYLNGFFWKHVFLCLLKVFQSLFYFVFWEIFQLPFFDFFRVKKFLFLFEQFLSLLLSLSVDFLFINNHLFERSVFSFLVMKETRQVINYHGFFLSNKRTPLHKAPL